MAMSKGQAHPTKKMSGHEGMELPSPKHSVHGLGHMAAHDHAHTPMHETPQAGMLQGE